MNDATSTFLYMGYTVIMVMTFWLLTGMFTGSVPGYEKVDSGIRGGISAGVRGMSVLGYEGISAGVQGY